MVNKRFKKLKMNMKKTILAASIMSLFSSTAFGYSMNFPSNEDEKVEKRVEYSLEKRQSVRNFINLEAKKNKYKTYWITSDTNIDNALFLNNPKNKDWRINIAKAIEDYNVQKAHDNERNTGLNIHLCDDNKMLIANNFDKERFAIDLNLKNCEILILKETPYFVDGEGNRIDTKDVQVTNEVVNSDYNSGAYNPGQHNYNTNRSVNSGPATSQQYQQPNNPNMGGTGNYNYNSPQQEFYNY